jgi:AraC-like DNA-binding protein
MNSMELYEKIPEGESPVRLIDYKRTSYLITPHWHEHIELHYIFEGNGIIRCGEKIIEVKKGDCLIINSNELHEGIKGKCSYGCIIIPPSFIEPNHVIFKRYVRDSEVSNLAENIFDAYRRADKRSVPEIKGYTYLLMAYLIKHYKEEELSEGSYRKHFEKLGKINEAIKFINENYTENVTTEGLSKRVHLSEGYFCHLFKEVTGKTAKEYLLSLRLKKAEDLLRSTEMSITEIGCCCGFSDPNYFTRIFKKKKGKIPSKIKK